MDGWEGKDKRRKIDGTPGCRLFFGSSFHLFGSWFVGCGRKKVCTVGFAFRREIDLVGGENEKCV
jgi:hypothetical protein